ncbi:hypothetical protein HQ520_08295 [bacterium]|nr:hypothetical protein [bacterium]
MTTIFEGGHSPRRAVSFWKLILLAGLVPLMSASAQNIEQTVHNLSLTGPGDVHALTEERICIFCHTPHAARTEAPLWNRNDPVSTYLPYDSPSLIAQPGQPTGASKLCLSCHDGTIALGDLLSEQQILAMTGGGFMSFGGGLIGTDLRDDHPVSFEYQISLSQAPDRLSPPGQWDPRVRLDSAGQLQCTSCHDPHDDQWGRFLVMDNTQAALCRQCHTYSFFDLTPHALSPMTRSGAGQDPWPHTDYETVGANACLNCHRSHHAPGQAELVSSAIEEEVCFVCHDGFTASTDVQAVFQKMSRHPVAQTQGVHQTGEDPQNVSDHVECADCHNPHRAHQGTAQAPFVKGVLEGVSGVDAAGLPLQESRYEYEICFKCHAESGAEPFDAIPRQVPSLNTRLEFAPSSPSYHPVQAPGVNPDVPSLIQPLDEGSVIYCSECHNNDGAVPEGTGPAGPHGSSHAFLLSRRYDTGDDVQESSQSYALCYECHSRESILLNESFPGHELHIAQMRTPCSVCHDPHGIPLGEGTTQGNAHLINFDVSVASPDLVTRRLEYQSLGPGQGECYVFCHNVNHSPLGY